MIAATFNLAGAAIYLREKDRVYRSSPNYMDVTAAELRDAAFTRDHRRDEERNVTLVPILLGHAADWCRRNHRRSGTSPEALDAVCGLAAIAIERAGAVETLTRVQASRESERLRNALLDSVAHELRTPLTSITAAITSLRSDPLLDKEQSARDDAGHRRRGRAARPARRPGDGDGGAGCERHQARSAAALHARSGRSRARSGAGPAQELTRIELRLPDTLAAGPDGSRAHRQGAAASAGKRREVLRGGKPHLRQRRSRQWTARDQCRGPRRRRRRLRADDDLRQVLSRAGPAISRAGHRHGAWPSRRRSSRRMADRSKSPASRRRAPSFRSICRCSSLAARAKLRQIAARSNRRPAL